MGGVDNDVTFDRTLHARAKGFRERDAILN